LERHGMSPGHTNEETGRLLAPWTRPGMIRRDLRCSRLDSSVTIQLITHTPQREPKLQATLSLRTEARAIFVPSTPFQAAESSCLLRVPRPLQALAVSDCGSKASAPLFAMSTMAGTAQNDQVAELVRLRNNRDFAAATQFLHTFHRAFSFKHFDTEVGCAMEHGRLSRSSATMAITAPSDHWDVGWLTA
jgi:hypothetical protein